MSSAIKSLVNLKCATDQDVSIGQGIATRALPKFPPHYFARPLYARVAHDNSASRHVLEKCGFVITGTNQGFVNVWGKRLRSLH